MSERTADSWSVRSLHLFPVLFVMILLGFWGVRDFFHDDALISLRYARNLLGGHGLVWNPGEYVEGYSNFLHLLGSAGLGYLGVDLRVATRIIGVVSYGAVVLLTIGYLLKLDSGGRGRHSMSLVVCSVSEPTPSITSPT